MNLDDLGLVIQAARKNRKYTQASLAAQVGMSRSSISGIENGSIPEIGIRKIIALCDVLGLELLVQAKTQRPTLQQLIRQRDGA